MNPQFPIYIVSKGRWESRLTSKALELLQVPYFVVIEEQEYTQYAAVIDCSKLLVLDKSYQDNYDTCDDLGSTRSKGSGAARNFAWDHAVAKGFSWYWCVDDNIRHFFWWNDNHKIYMTDGACFAAMEDFCLRYTNIAMAGPHYAMFVPRKKPRAPLIFNTRIYSCNLIRTDIPFRWRCRYNEDTDLSLRILKAGWCTVLFRTFLQHKMPTQHMPGGNTTALYGDGTRAKSEMLWRLHPDVTKLVIRYGRHHHQVNYGVFKSNVLRRKELLQVAATPKYTFNVSPRVLTRKGA